MTTTPVSRRPRLLAAAVITATLLWGVGLVSLPAASALHLSNLGLTVLPLAAGAAAVLRGRQHTGRVRLFWRRLGAASLAWGAGMAAWSWYESLRGLEVPFPSAADLGYLASPLLAGWALLTLPLAAPTRAGRARTILDGLIVASSLLLVSWMLVLDSIVQAGGDVASQAISLAYPVSDIVLITAVIYTWMRARSSGADLGVSLPLIGVGLVALAVADSGFVYLTTAGVYSSGNWIDLGWGAGFCLLLLAALRLGGDAAEVPEGEEEVAARPLGNLLPYAAVGVALLTSSMEVLRGETTGTMHFWMRTSIMLLLVARQILTLLENHALTRDLERRVEARTAEVRASGERFAALVQHSSDLVTVVDRCGTVLYQSQSSERLLGYAADSMVGRPLAEVMSPAHAADLITVMDGVSSDADRVQTVQSTWRHASGRECQVEITLTNLLANPAVGGVVLNTRDVTDRMSLERQLTHQAFTDSLTDLPNRALFKDRLMHALSRRADAPPLAVYFLDLDGFKGVNDTLGHSAGDELLVEVAARLRSAVRPSDTVARFGGDEFAILVEDLSEGDDGTALAQRVCDAIAAPIQLSSGEVHIAASIGIAHRDDPSTDAEQMLRNADLAMYQAKGSDVGFTVFAPEMHEGLVARMRLEADLRKALSEDQFVVYYQPMVSMRTGEITGVEALVRWQHPERGLVPPNDFIPLAEATGLIRPLGLWVLRESCRQAVAWEASGGPRGLKLSVNVSARQLQQDDLVDRVAEILRETGMPAQQLTLEMTESVLLDTGEDTLSTLTALRDLGIRLAIDDFGTGYSSLSYLHSFPVDILKIDRSFVQRLSTGGDTALISTILRLGQTMKLETVAEGIEHPQEMLLLRRQGCTTGQGYHFSPPVPAARIEDLLAEGGPDGPRGVPTPRPETVTSQDILPLDGILPVEAVAGQP